MDRKTLSELLAAVYENADPQWREFANAAVRFSAQERQEITTDDVWDLVENFDVETHENRAIGPVMRGAAKAGIIERTDRTITTRRNSRNRGDVRVWRSLIYKDPS
jgi:hypothetical protein